MWRLNAEAILSAKYAIVCIYFLNLNIEHILRLFVLFRRKVAQYVFGFLLYYNYENVYLAVFSVNA